jgi:hypothetical protein
MSAVTAIKHFVTLLFLKYFYQKEICFVYLAFTRRLYRHLLEDSRYDQIYSEIICTVFRNFLSSLSCPLQDVMFVRMG